MSFVTGRPRGLGVFLVGARVSIVLVLNPPVTVHGVVRTSRHPTRHDQVRGHSDSERPHRIGQVTLSQLHRFCGSACPNRKMNTKLRGNSHECCELSLAASESYAESAPALIAGRADVAGDPLGTILEGSLHCQRQRSVNDRSSSGDISQ